MNNIIIHEEIVKKLDYFISIQKIPNIIFHGPSGSGKREIVNIFIKKIYNYDQDILKNNIMHVNCAHGKGIKFIREDLKFFAKTNINCLNGNFFKSIILFNADKLTIDAQSALRRCIELFSHNTRFFIVVEDKYKLLKPILSRFCEIYVPLPIINNEYISLYKYNLDKNLVNKKEKMKRFKILIKILQEKISNYLELFNLADKLYNKAYSGIDLIAYIEKMFPDNKNKYKLLITYQKFKKEFRNEKTCILFLLNYIYFRYNDSLENISFM